MDDQPDSELDRDLARLVADAPAPDPAARADARRALQDEIRAESGRSKRRRRPRWLGGRLGVVLAGLILGSGALAVGNELRQSVFRSDTEPPVYSLEPLDTSTAERLQQAIDEAGGASATTGDLQYCLRHEADGDVDASCAVLLQAHRDGQLEPRPGPLSMVHAVPCGVKPGPGEVSSCGSEVSERELERALARAARAAKQP